MLLIWGLAGFNQFFQIVGFWPSRAECLLLGLFRGRMSSWCSFRCTCLDELESKSDLNKLYDFCCKMCVCYGFQTVRLMDDSFWSGGFFGVAIWFMTKWWCWLLISKSFAGFDVADFRPRWIQYFVSKMQVFGLFRGRMSSWCSFRCTCLDELESKSDVTVPFLLPNVCIPCSLVLWFGSWQKGGVDYWSAKLSLDSMLLIWGLAGFNQFFQIVGFWPSRAECLLLGLFRGRMSSWCSFRCTCLDELESKSDVNIL